jgi:hypothetical protein
MGVCRRRGLVLGLTLALAGSACGGSGRLGTSALSEQAKTLGSEAAEGALLAHDAASGRATGTYLREHSSYLADAASAGATTLRAATTARALEPLLRRLSAAADQVSTDLMRLGHASPGERRGLARDLQAAARAIERISAELG